MATYAIGDIQGCYDELRQLLKKIDFHPARDQLWLVGDLVNRGPGSLEVLRYLQDLGDSVQAVLGNHDLHLLAVAEGVRKARSADTLGKLLKAKDAPQLLDWLSRLPLFYRDEALGYSMTHAGIPPNWTLNQAQSLAEEVRQALLNGKRKQVLSGLFGNKPAIWSDDLRGDGRLRCIVNYLTRMRFCTPEGLLDLDSKNTASQAPKGYAAWFSYPSPAVAESKLVFGHWAALNGVTNVPDIHALDTGCAWGLTLTAMRLEDQQRFQVAAKKR